MISDRKLSDSGIQTIHVDLMYLLQFAASQVLTVRQPFIKENIIEMVWNIFAFFAVSHNEEMICVCVSRK